jgi:hypothetical protein
MTAQRVIAAQRNAAQQIVAPQITKARLTWGKLGFSQVIGLCCAVGGPHATFPAMAHTSPRGAGDYVLGHRVA